MQVAQPFAGSDLFALVSATGTVKIEAVQHQMSSSPWRPLEEQAAASLSLAHYQPRRTPSSLTAMVSITTAQRLKPFAAKTLLGRKLVEIRQRALANGMQLLTEDEIREEIGRRRGELVE